MRFNLILESTVLDRHEEKEVDDYNKRCKQYHNFFSGNKQIENDRDAFKPWEDIFKKGVFQIQVMSEEEMIPKNLRKKNLS